MILALLALFAPLPSTAQVVGAHPPGTIETSRAIVAKLNISRTLDPLFAQLMPLMVANVENAMAIGNDIPPALKRRLNSDDGRKQIGVIISEEFMAAFRTRYADIAEALAEEYRKSFDETELTTILAFYRSNAGAKLLMLQPQFQQTLSEQGRALGREAGAIAGPKIEARIAALDAATSK